MPSTTAPTVPAHPLAAAPPMSAVAAVSGLLATLLVRVLVPTRDPDAPLVAWHILSRIGDFLVNLTIIASMVALVMGLWPWLRGVVWITARRRLLVASFCGMLVPVWLRAVFFAREEMNGALAGLGAATAYSLSTLLVMSAVVGARARPAQLMPAVLVTVTTVCSLLLMMAQSLAIIAPLNPVHRFTWLIADMGEAAYLGVLLCAVTLLPRPPWSLRRITGMATGVGVLLAVAIAFLSATRMLGRDFAVALYYAQHVTWFLDGAIALYALPFSVGLGASVAAWIGGDAMQRQLALALMAWIGAGFAPRAPWRFVLLAMGACLIARAIATYRELAAIETVAAPVAEPTPSEPSA